MKLKSISLLISLYTLFFTHICQAGLNYEIDAYQEIITNTITKQSFPLAQFNKMPGLSRIIKQLTPDHKGALTIEGTGNKYQDLNLTLKSKSAVLHNLNAVFLNATVAEDMTLRGNTQIHKTTDFEVGSLFLQNGKASLYHGKYRVRNWFEVSRGATFDSGDKSNVVFGGINNLGEIHAGTLKLNLEDDTFVFLGKIYVNKLETKFEDQVNWQKLLLYGQFFSQKGQPLNQYFSQNGQSSPLPKLEPAKLWQLEVNLNYKDPVLTQVLAIPSAEEFYLGTLKLNRYRLGSARVYTTRLAIPSKSVVTMWFSIAPVTIEGNTNTFLNQVYSEHKIFVDGQNRDLDRYLIEKLPCYGRARDFMSPSNDNMLVMEFNKDQDEKLDKEELERMFQYRKALQ